MFAPHVDTTPQFVVYAKEKYVSFTPPVCIWCKPKFISKELLKPCKLL